MLRFAVVAALALVFSFPVQAAGPAPYFGTLPALAPDPAASLSIPQADWYKDEVFYHIWLYSFADADGNGVGDLRGVTAKLDYLKDLGATSLWLSPFWKSPSTHGYDVVDYSVVDPRYGTNDDLKTLLQEAHHRGLKVIFDFVPNHVSARNPWFLDSRDRKNGKDDWFLWRSQVPDQGWKDFGGGTAWRRAGDRYYYALFWDQMPDLNYRNPEVRQAMGSVVVQWLNFGFDGMRIDAVKYLFEDEKTGANADQPETLQFFRELRRQVVEPYAALGSPKMMVSENWTDDPQSLAAYLTSDGKKNDGLEATLDFPFGQTVTRAVRGQGTVGSLLERQISTIEKPLAAAGGWTFTFLSNHDNYQARPATLFRDPAQVKLALTLQLTGPGTPVLYYGNEVGMPGANGNDQNMRRPFPWASVEGARADETSVWSWTALLNQIRRDHPALRRGDWSFPTATRSAAYLRTLGKDRILVVTNASEDPVEVTVDVGTEPSSVKLLAGTGQAEADGSLITVADLEPWESRIYQLVP